MSGTRSPDVIMTADAFVAWSGRQSGTGRHELFDGTVVTMAAERAIHTRTKYAVTRCLEQAIADARLACEALVDGMAVRVDDETVFEPDALVRCGPRLSDDAVVIDDPIVHHRRGEGERIETAIYTAGPVRFDPPGLCFGAATLFPPSGGDD